MLLGGLGIILASAGTVDFEDMEVGHAPPAPWKYGSSVPPDHRKYPGSRPEIEIVEIRYDQWAQKEKPYTLTWEKLRHFNIFCGPEKKMGCRPEGY